jgi:hypothetical protein
MEKVDYKSMNNASLMQEMKNLEERHAAIKDEMLKLYSEMEDIDTAYNMITLELKKRHVYKA